MKDKIEITNVDAQLKSRGANNAGVGPVIEAFLRRSTLFKRDRTVVDEYVRAASSHAIGYGFRQSSALAEEQALLTRGTGSSIGGHRCYAVVKDHPLLPLARHFRRINDDSLPL